MLNGEAFNEENIQHNNAVLGCGLPVEALAEFSQKVQSIARRRSIPPEVLRHRLLQELEQLDQAVGLEALVQSRKSELEKVEQAVARANQEREGLKAVVSGLKQEKASLETGIKETREKVSREIAGILPVAKDTVNQFATELQHGLKEALEEIRRLWDETLVVGKEFGSYEQIIQANQWLNELLALVRGEDSIEAQRVRAILLPILRGVVVCLKYNKPGNLGFSILLHHTENLVKEVEEWKV